ncbi:hypothetical protein HT094_20090 [Shewanella sp. ZOR0012]|uniref:hypothetical protein n=1 Tax=Shewanella sp. ZOR0012 TaxID=1339231 RepID=UPI00068EE835|nr:hypothetical protein [Shewanella sp. ZOR0012]NSM26442.1 hypothetical protein [Shewanella sp. ZOR0012]
MEYFLGPDAEKVFLENHEKLSAESDRGAVILSASLLDSALEDNLKAFLLSPVNKNDELFSGRGAPLGTFSSKIEMCYRLGIISVGVRSQLNKFKAIRNDFAHNLDSAKLDDEANKDRMLAILRSEPGIPQALNSIVIQGGTKCDKSFEKNLLDGFGSRHTFNLLFAVVCMWLKRSAISIEKINYFEQKS